MTVAVERIYDKAINLNPIEKAELIDKLFDSFIKKPFNEKIEEEWKQELIKRRTAFDNGEISADNIENVFERLSKR